MQSTRHPIDPNKPCILWSGAIQSQGYGSVAVGDGSGKSMLAHRKAWEAANGEPVPPGLTVDHVCFVRRCINPYHLEAVTQRENNRRARERKDANRRDGNGILWCVNGHPQTDENVNVRLRKNGEVRNVCMPCAREFNRRAYRAARARGENPNAKKIARRSALRAAARAAKAADAA